MEKNWAGNYAYRASKLHRPSTVEQLQEIVARAPRVRMLGTRHSFNEIADSAELIAFDALPSDVIVDHAAGEVSLGTGLIYSRLAAALEPEGVALHNLASLPHVSVAGAIATGTHGSGTKNGNLATAVAGLELVTSSGEIITARRGEAQFDGMVVGLGALGAVTRLILDVEPAYDVRQRVFQRLSWDALLDHFDEIATSGYSVSVFTHFGPTVDQVWVKSRVTDAPEDARDDLFGGIPATVDMHPIAGMDPVNSTAQLGRPGLWSDRLTHFRSGYVASSGEELQSEYMVPREQAAEAIKTVRALGGSIDPLLHVCEIRMVAADRLWMSPQYGRDTVAIHFTWRREQDAVERVLVDIEKALARFEARPHWGKLFLAGAAEIRPLYERLPDFSRLVERLDPRGAFRNSWLETHVLGS